MTIQEKKEIVENVINNIDTIINKAIYDNEVEIVGMNKSQLWSGVNADETEIFPDYTIFTIGIKIIKGQPTDRVTLKDTGSFYDEIFAEAQGDNLIIDSRDVKSKSLKEKYGEDIFGLSEPHKKELSSIIKEYIINEL